MKELPLNLKRRLMTNYLFDDLLIKVKLVFKTYENRDSKFLYDICFGFLPRYFDPNEKEDKIIYDEESDVPEMYFGL